MRTVNGRWTTPALSVVGLDGNPIRLTPEGGAALDVVPVASFVVDRARMAFRQRPHDASTVEEWIGQGLDEKLTQAEDSLLGGQQLKLEPEFVDDGGDRTVVAIAHSLCERIQGEFALAAPGIVESPLAWLDTLIWEATADVLGWETPNLADLAQRARFGRLTGAEVRS